MRGYFIGHLRRGQRSDGPAARVFNALAALGEHFALLALDATDRTLSFLLETLLQAASGSKVQRKAEVDHVARAVDNAFCGGGGGVDVV